MVSQEASRQETWFVVYAKIVDDKEDGISLAGVYFGGAGNTRQVAEGIARECVNGIKGGTIMPKLYEAGTSATLPSIMTQAEAFFKKKEAEMITTAEIISRSHKRK